MTSLKELRDSIWARNQREAKHPLHSHSCTSLSQSSRIPKRCTGHLSRPQTRPCKTTSKNSNMSSNANSGASGRPLPGPNLTTKLRSNRPHKQSKNRPVRPEKIGARWKRVSDPRPWICNRKHNLEVWRTGLKCS